MAFISGVARPFFRSLGAFLFCTVAASSGTVEAVAVKSKPPVPAVSAVPAKGAAGYVIDRIPGWVRPVAAAAPNGLTPSSVQVLLLDRQVRVERVGATHYFHAVRQINDSTGLQKAAQIEIEFDPSYQKLALHQLVIWRGTQRIDKLDPKLVTLLHRETQLERQMVDGRMTASIVLDDLRVGDRIEWAGSLAGDNPVFGGRFVDIQWTQSDIGPIGTFELRVSAPRERNIRHSVGNKEIEVETAVQGERIETVFRRKNVAQFRFDPLLPAGEYLREQIEFSEFADWGEVATWAEGLFAGATRVSPAVDARAAEIEAQSAVPQDRLRLALDFVQQDIRYFGTEGGADSHRPASAEAVLRQRFGDCKDKVALLTALLQRLGMPTTPALVSTRYGAQAPQRLPSPLAFDHAIAAVVVDGQTLWLDGTRASQAGAAETRQPVGLGYALAARADSKALQPLPPAAGALRSVTVDTFRFPALAREGTLESVTTYHGEVAEWIREARQQLSAADFEKFAVGELLRFYPTLVLDGEPELEPVPGSNAVTLRLRLRTGRFWKFPEQRVLVGNFALLSLLAPLRLPDQTPRTQPLRVSMQGRYLHTVRFEFGEPTFSKPSSSRFDENNAQFGLTLRYAGDRQLQTIDGELTLSAERIEAAQWAAYRDMLSKVAPRLGASISISAIGPEQTDALRSELGALEENVRRGNIAVLTRNQFEARSRLLVLDKQLGAGRLADDLRAEALVARAIQLDHLGRNDEAHKSLDNALALDANNADAHAASAVNAFQRRDDGAALAYAQTALRLAPSDPAPRDTRAWAQYFSGDYSASKAELVDILPVARRGRTQLRRHLALSCDAPSGR